MPLVWISKWTDTPLSNRVYGPDLFERFCGLSEGKGYSHFFYGSSPKVLNLLTQTIRQRFPRIRIVGFISPPYRPLYGQEENRFIEEINESGADVLWVGLGCPKQEKWMVSVRDRIRVPVIAAIGAAFDFHAGVVKQAPPFWQKHGLEWLFRLLQEPRRLSIRYLVYNPWFLIRLTKQILK
jgi:N-acetylglucosaminyldiphosphoundecaprenol N-acetyl-beta-D-mannosaminyltransferase